ncbi:DUF2786 domain-containing protein [Streptomyces sp. ME19-03-3]|nr:DUF2786 domain-containing protein [Streptomyces sp. ME19-03-3]
MRDAMTVVEAAFAGALGAPEGDVERALDAGASALAAEAGWDEVGRAVVTAFGGLLRGCRARGWEDADLLRMARRELRPEHVRLAGRLAVDGEGDAGPAGVLAAYGAAERLDRFAVATVVLELVRLLGRLPGITAPAASAPAASGTAGHPMLRRIRALLAKAESTAFPEEAEALSAKAQHLMARHSVDEALVAGTAQGGGPGARRIGVERPYEAPKALLLDAVAAANRCRAVWSAEFGFSTVVGWEADLEAVEVLYTSLLVQAEAAMRRGGGAGPAGGPGRKGGRGGKGGRGASPSRDFRESFLIAYAGRIGERLSAASRDAAEEAAQRPEGTGVLPVLAAREVAVGRAADEMFPHTSTERLRGRDREGWEHGTAAADRAAFHGPVGRSTRSRG